jgi:hypothetical protein
MYKEILGKQGRRLMTNPTSLCARVLKGRYFPNDDFMTTHKKKNASHTWRAILASGSVLELGLIRRIRDDTSTNIWNDKWIPNAIVLKPICRQEGATTIRVCALLNQAGSLDEGALVENLVPMDAAAVRCIPLGRITEDLWAWSGGKHGNYLVRSANRMLVESANHEEDHSQGRPSHSGAQNSSLWKKLWCWKAPSKVRVFWWRVSNKFVPSRFNLHC